MKCSYKFAIHAACFALLFFFISYVYAEPAPRPFDIKKYANAGLEVWVPARPEWPVQLDARKGTQAVMLSSPDNYYPRSVIEIVFNYRLRVENADLQAMALVALNEVRNSAGMNEPAVLSDLVKVEYGNITGYQDQFDVEFNGQEFTMQVVMGTMPSLQPITLLLTTPKGQIDHISTMRDKMYGKLSALPEVLPQ